MALIVVPVFALGCGDESSSAAISEVVDSAGVQIVTHRSLPSRIGALGESPVRVAGRDDDLTLYQVVGGILRSDGSIVLANAGSNEVLMLDQNGDELRRVGRSGDGPGEFGAISWVQARTDRGFNVGDSRNRRVSAFGPEGDLLWTETFNPQTEAPPSPNALAARGFALYATDEGDLIGFPTAVAFPDGQPGLLPLTGQLFRYGSDASSPDVLGPLQVIEWYEDPSAGSIPLGNLLGGSRLEYSGHSGRLAYTEGSSFSVEVLDDGVRTMSIREARPRVPFEPDSVPSNVSHIADSLPAYRDVAVDSEHRIWVRAPLNGNGVETEWRVFDEAGAWVGSVRLSENAALLDANGGQLLLLTRDELDVESVEVRELSWPS
jgi:hypothetical protein